MPRPVYTGTLGWGLVTVPVKLYSARTPQSIKFKQINKTTGALVKQKRVDASTGDEVPYENIVKGYELGNDNYLRVDPDELADLSPKQTKRIDIEQFVDLGDVDPLLYDDSYFVGPDKGAEKVYRLLAETMLADGRAAIGRVVLRSKQKLCVIRPNATGVLLCSTVVWADEVNDHVWIAAPIADPANECTEAERAQAGMLIAALAGDFDHQTFVDEYRQRVMQLIDAKAAGKELTSNAPAVAEAAAPDLMAALQASVAAATTEKSAAQVPEKVAA